MLMLKEDFWDLVEHVLPLYIILFFGYAFVKLGYLQSVHGPGLSRWVSLVAVPVYIFHLLINIDPYKINLRLVAADAVQKAVALILGSLWWKVFPSGSIDGLIVFYNLSTLPNTVLIGESLLIPLYGKDPASEVEIDIVTIIFLQSLIWYNVNLALLVTRDVLINLKHSETAPESKFSSSGPTQKYSSDTKASPDQIANGPIISSNSTNVTSSSAAIDIYGRSPARSELQSRNRLLHALLKSPTPPSVATSTPASAAQQSVLSSAGVSPGLSMEANARIAIGDEEMMLQEFQAREEGVRSCTSPVYFLAHHVSQNSLDFHEKPSVADQGRARALLESEASAENHFTRGLVESAGYDSPHKSEPGPKVSWTLIALRVLNLLRVAPLTHATLFGFAYALLSRKFNWNMPYPIEKAETLVSGGSVGVVAFLLGVQWANSGRLVSCGIKKLSYSMVIRFLVGPILMTGASIVSGLHGATFKFAVLQAVIPQGVISFVYAKEYNLEVDLFATAVMFQLIVFLPIALGYYFILQYV